MDTDIPIFKSLSIFYRFIAIVNPPLQLISIGARKMILYLD